MHDTKHNCVTSGKRKDIAPKLAAVMLTENMNFGKFDKPNLRISRLKCAPTGLLGIALMVIDAISLMERQN